MLLAGGLIIQYWWSARLLAVIFWLISGSSSELIQSEVLALTGFTFVLPGSSLLTTCQRPGGCFTRSQQRSTGYMAQKATLGGAEKTSAIFSVEMQTLK
jgi:hypothetical protein